MAKETNLMLFIIYLLYIFLIRSLLEARAEIQKYFRWFLVQMKSLEFAFEINWPLGSQKDCENSCYFPWSCTLHKNLTI